MTYAVTVDMDLPKGAPELDVLQREGVVFLLRKGLDSIAAIEGPDGMEVDLVDDVIAVHPGGALLKLFIDAPALEFAEDAAREVVAELLERTEPLADWEITRCGVDLHPELLQESLDAADGPDAPPADPAERARRHAAAEPSGGTGRVDEAADAEDMRRTLRALAPSLRAFPIEAFGHSDDEEERIVSREAAEVAAGALVYAIDLLVDELFTDLAGLEEDGPTVAETDAPFMILDELPPQFGLQYTVLFVRRLTVTAVTMTGRLTQPDFGRPSCLAEELLLKFLVAQAEATADLYELLSDEVETALQVFAEGVSEDMDHEWLYAPAVDGNGNGIGNGTVQDWFIPFDDDERYVHPYAANGDSADEDLD
ncbi:MULTISPECIES: hypothetical protein [unclassified Streptomyces]|uniref:hypothetical protein n=2 Tax=unclassified Streptomyces TaxID=2593676 RepID=UPI00225E2EDA|nr:MULTISPECIES: hypothetical protein [unclassified Streptomyces]MCX4885649.1 hypothetical protein [Streptomyces sp. NBC_00847]